MRISRLWVATGIAVLVLAGCSGSSAATYGGYREPAASAAYVPVQGNDGGFSGGKPQGSAAPAPVAASGAPQGSGQQSNGQVNAPKPEDFIIKTGLVRVQVNDLDGTIIRVSDVMHSFGGYLAGSQRTNDTSSGLASVTYRVPASKFEDALAEIRKIGKVLNEHSETTPVGGQIVDIQARIDNLKSTEKAIQSVMAKASSIPDILTVQSRLSDVQGQIEELTAQVQSLTDQATYSTLTVELELPAPVASPSPSPSPSPTASPVAGWTVGDEFGKASGALGTVVEATVTVLIWIVVVVVPIGIGLLVLAFFALLAIRLWRRMVPVVRREAGFDPIPTNPEQ